MKKIVALLLVMIVAVSVIAIPCSAEQISFTNSYKSTVYEKYGVSCTLTNPGKKNASVKVTLASSKISKWGTYAMDILMKDEYGRVIWAEDDSIVAKKAYFTSRTYKLGKDHSQYRLFFRPSTTSMNACAYVTVGEPKQCTLGICYDKNV